MICKKCKHEIEKTNKDGRTTYKHKTEDYHEGDGGDYHYCNVEMKKCSCGCVSTCRCTTPEPEG